MNKTTKKVLLIVIGFIAAIIVLGGIIISIVFSSISKVQKADYYTMGEDRIPSVKSVLGERKVSHVSKAINNGVATNTYTFNSETAKSDADEYSKYLVEQAGYLVTDVGQGDDYIVYGKTSAEKGNIILISIENTAFEFEVTLQKGEGTLTPTE